MRTIIEQKKQNNYSYSLPTTTENENLSEIKPSFDSNEHTKSLLLLQNTNFFYIIQVQFLIILFLIICLVYAIFVIYKIKKI
jgi:hypothetical protein